MHVHDCTIRNGDDCVPLNAPSRHVLVERLRCECGNGLVPIIWEGTSAGDPWDIRTHGGNITNATFRDTVLSRTKLGITIKSLPMMTGTAQDITFENIAVDQVGTAILIDTVSQDRGAGAIQQSPPTGPGGDARQGHCHSEPDRHGARSRQVRLYAGQLRRDCALRGAAPGRGHVQLCGRRDGDGGGVRSDTALVPKAPTVKPDDPWGLARGD